MPTVSVEVPGGNIEPLEWRRRWGDPGVRLLPTSLAREWGDESLPAWVCEELGLTPNASLELLGHPKTLRSGASSRLREYLALLVQSRVDTIRHIVAVERGWPAALSFHGVPWTVRTKNCLILGGLVTRLPDLASITIGDLLSVRALGARSVLDFACTLEAMIDVLVETEGVRGVALEERKAAASAVLIAAQNEPWIDWISECDPRFAELLPVGSGTLAERIDQLNTNPASTVQQCERLAAAVQATRLRISELSNLSLEALLEDYLRQVARVNGPRLAGLVARLQLNGQSKAITLEDAGAIGGVTRERMRQLEARALASRPPHPVVLPALDSALRVLAQAAPVEAGHAAARLVEEGIAARPFHPASVLAAAEFASRSDALRVESVFGSEMVTNQPELGLPAEVSRVAYRQAGLGGAVNTSEVAEALARSGWQTTEKETRELLKRLGRMEFLSDTWFWVPDRPSDFIKTVTRKMLAVTSPLDIASLREGLKRAFRFRNSSQRRNRSWLPAVPPRDILMAYFRAHPGFAITPTGEVRSVSPIDDQSELSSSEQVVVQVLRSAPGQVLDRNSMSEKCGAQGLNLGTLAVFITYSPILERVAPGICALRGTNVDPAVVQALLSESAARPVERQLVDYGWKQEGDLWITFSLSIDPEHRVLNIPGTIARFVCNREFESIGDDDTAFGPIRVHETGLVSGQGAFLRRSGADEGDLFLMQFNLVRNRVILRLIDDEDLDELRGQQ